MVSDAGFRTILTMVSAIAITNAMSLGEHLNTGKNIRLQQEEVSSQGTSSYFKGLIYSDSTCTLMVQGLTLKLDTCIAVKPNGSYRLKLNLRSTAYERHIYTDDSCSVGEKVITGVDIDDKCTYFKDGNFYYKTSISSTSALVVPYVGKMTRYAGQPCSSKFCCMEGFNIQCKGV